MTFDPLQVLIAVTIFTFAVCGWAYWAGRKEAQEEEQVADDGVAHTKEYYDNDRNR
jgi:flagellar basal body-associated protein FliL